MRTGQAMPLVTIGFPLQSAETFFPTLKSIVNIVDERGEMLLATRGTLEICERCCRQNTRNESSGTILISKRNLLLSRKRSQAWELILRGDNLPNTYEDPDCQETDFPSERFFAFFPLSRGS